MERSKQKDKFLNFEANNWFERNINHIKGETKDQLFYEILSLAKNKNSDLSKIKILEIGCSNGHRLKSLKNEGLKCHGIDPSNRAILDALNNGLDCKVGTADELDYNSNEFDIVVFGFCLYLCDPDDYFKIANEANRVLKNKGHIVILDFYSKMPYSNKYIHAEGIKSHKMDFSALFNWHPNYSLVKLISGSHENFSYTENIDDLIAIHILNKNCE